ncbi:phage major capsid protein, P2 family [Acinetobacter parvus]|uniref:phage major capsid protein, P2 family n=1 Tax=Acinetobacter parvus TaxID=134533 RepID=UPI001FD68DF2|nr:phage major capsid protein, P2 family [Acinetobacter parvus]MCU4392785.1 phage major capsid protein, P2 family [Acinetobacter parvus]
MLLFTRKKYTAAMVQLASVNGVETVNTQFNVLPSVQQKLETKIQESSEFLSRINIFLVEQMSGERIGMGISGPIASRTNVDVEDRQTKDPSTLDSRKYLLQETDFNTHIKYSTLDQWAKFQDFYVRFRSVIVKRQALDRIMIGFNGIKISATTDIAANPLLQDVNKGWLQKQREENPTRVLSSGSVVGKVTVGKTGDFKNLDALVMNITDEFIAPWHQNADLVVICSRKLQSDKYFPLVNKDQENSEKLAADIIISQKRMGNLPVYAVPFFPEDTLLVTTFDNLSIYVQEGARRRTIIDNAKRKRIENYESSNEDYMIEDLELCAMAEKIEILPE